MHIYSRKYEIFIWCVCFVEKADSCTMNAVTFLKQFEIATVNSTGQLKVWDLREQNQQPMRTFFM